MSVQRKDVVCGRLPLLVGGGSGGRQQLEATTRQVVTQICRPRLRLYCKQQPHPPEPGVLNRYFQEEGCGPLAGSASVRVIQSAS